MFGSKNGAAAGGSGRPAAAEVARIEGNLTHVLYHGSGADALQVFVNGQPVPTGEIESLSIEIAIPDEGNSAGVVHAILSRYQAGADGQRQERGTALFPGTVEIIARGRRIVVTCQEPGSFEGLWLGLGLRADGTSSELTGVQSLRVVAAPGLLDGKLVWSEDGTTEDLLPIEQFPSGTATV